MCKSILTFLLFMLNVWQAQAQTINIAGPAGSGQFGKKVTVLTNGNFVVMDPLYDEGPVADVGVVYLYDGNTYALISTLKGSTANDSIGSGGIAALSNGNFLVKSSVWNNGALSDAGAITWCSGTTGLSGVVSSSNSLVGSSTGDLSTYSITILNNSNYLVISPNWDNGTIANAGAITWCSGTTGLSGVVSSSNSLVGSSTDDFLNYSVTILSNGNYLVSIPNWDNGVVVNAGAVTWGNCNTGVSGVISSSNSLVGSLAGDFLNNIITVLTNGNYLISNPAWDNNAVANTGAVTWGSGSAGISGVISNVNSLVGSTTNDSVGNKGITILNTGSYLVKSPKWDNGSATDAGAVTWGNGVTGISGEVSSSNSLVGSTSNDQVGNRGVIVLTNGNYVVISPNWDNGTAINSGAVTWVNGTMGISGVVTSSNSLVGSTPNSQVGFDSVTALSNGNYVVISSLWINAGSYTAGAVTWGNGATGISGIVSSSNSLVGASNRSDRIGNGGVFALNNGNYIVRSPNWNSYFGAITWGNGNTGISGLIGSSNSLVGNHGGDFYSDAHTYPVISLLSNGNYLAINPYWDNGAVTDAGAITWGNGATGTFGIISSSNSLVGSKTNDLNYSTITELINGNYVAICPLWDNEVATDVGAVIWGNGNTGKSGVISSSNSLVGSTANDRVGLHGLVALTNGNYLVISPFWSSGSGIGAITWVNGLTGITGLVSTNNSLMSGAGPGTISGFILPLTNGNYVVYSPNLNIGSVSNAGAVTWGDGLTGITGFINSSNSLVGSKSDDNVGRSGLALSNGNYLVISPYWTNGTASAVGAVTWVNGATGITGFISSANSLIGSTTDDHLGWGYTSTILNNNNYVVFNPDWNNGAVPDAGTVTWGNGANGVTGTITSCNSVLGTTASGGSSITFTYNNTYNYLIVGRPSENIISIFSPVDLTLAGTLDTISTNISGLTATPIIASGGCRIIATLTPNGSSPLNGTVNAKVWIENAVPTYNGNPFVARHYEITPVTNASTATGKITLYFTQQDFDDFNAHAGSTFDLPTSDGDAVGKANLRIGKYPGISNNGTGLPDTYTGTPEVLDPIDADIVWNGSLSRWEISFNVVGFSGFIVQSSSPGLPLTLLELKGRLVNNDAVLNWKTTDEVNTLSFDIERSTDGRNYSTVGNVAAVNQPGIHQYNYIDNNIISLGVPVAYYRLKQNDIDGRFTYSKIVALPIDNRKSIVLFYPNPVTNEANLLITVNESMQLQGRILDNTGRVILQQQWSVGSGSTSSKVNVSTLIKGVYCLELKGKKINESIKFVKQ